MTVDIHLGFDVTLQNQKVRLYGINTPELRGITKVQGGIARDTLTSLLFNREIILESRKDSKEKYGRYLGILHTLQDDGTWLNVNQHLIECGVAIPFMAD